MVIGYSTFWTSVHPSLQYVAFIFTQLVTGKKIWIPKLHRQQSRNAIQSKKPLGVGLTKATKIQEEGKGICYFWNGCQERRSFPTMNKLLFGKNSVQFHVLPVFCFTLNISFVGNCMRWSHCHYSIWLAKVPHVMQVRPGIGFKMTEQHSLIPL